MTADANLPSARWLCSSQPIYRIVVVRQCSQMSTCASALSSSISNAYATPARPLRNAGCATDWRSQAGPDVGKRVGSRVSLLTSALGGKRTLSERPKWLECGHLPVRRSSDGALPQSAANGQQGGATTPKSRHRFAVCSRVKTGRRIMKSSLLKALPMAAVVMLVGCTTTTGYHHTPSAVEKAYYAQCATDPPTEPCGHS